MINVHGVFVMKADMLPISQLCLRAISDMFFPACLKTKPYQNMQDYILFRCFYFF